MIKFEASAAGLTKGLIPVIDVANKNVLKDFEFAGKIKLVVEQDALTACAWNGKMSIRNEISDLTTDELLYTCHETGSVVVDGSDVALVISSFRPSDQLIIYVSENGSGKEVVFSLLDDSEQYQTVPCYDADMDVPESETNIVKKTIIRRDAFLRGAAKVLFALGYEDRRPRYLYWVFRVSEYSLRFIAGTGARFAVMDMDGANLFKEKSETFDMMIPGESTKVIAKILSDINDEYVTIEQSDPKSNYQIIVSSGSSTIIMLGMDPDETYIDENVILDANYTEKFISEVADWEYAGKGAKATYDVRLKKESRPHPGQVLVDFEKNEVIVKTTERMRSSRKVKIIDKDTTNPKISFNASCPFLNEIADNAENDKYVQIEYIEDVDNKNRRPILVRYYVNDKVSSSNEVGRDNKVLASKEKFSVFFAQLQG